MTTSECWNDFLYNAAECLSSRDTPGNDCFRVGLNGNIVLEDFLQAYAGMLQEEHIVCGVGVGLHGVKIIQAGLGYADLPVEFTFGTVLVVCHVRDRSQSAFGEIHDYLLVGLWLHGSSLEVCPFIQCRKKFVKPAANNPDFRRTTNTGIVKGTKKYPHRFQ
jgi:hypothetical protein